MQFDPYLNFDGTCAEAFRFYQSCLGGELFTLTFGEAPGGMQVPPGSEQRLMHASLTTPGGAILMGSDAPPGWAEKAGGFSASISLTDTTEAEALFAALSEGGTVMVPPTETFWALRFAMFKDRFGTPWMINCSKPAPDLHSA